MAANDIQHDGDHYRNKPIQPWDFIAQNKIGFFEGSAISYLCRWQEKGGVGDLRKAGHFIDKLIEVETIGSASASVPLSCLDIITDYLGDLTGTRPGLPCIRHVRAGLVILKELNASPEAMDAYCIHPMVQEDIYLEDNMGALSQVNPITLMLAMEYRNVANRGVYGHQVMTPSKVYLGPLREVHLMLLADKVQDRKYFNTLNNSPEMTAKFTEYFKTWFTALGVSTSMYNRYAALIE